MMIIIIIIIVIIIIIIIIMLAWENVRTLGRAERSKKPNLFADFIP